MAMQNYYKVSGKICVALVTTGGGTTNAFTGLISAWMDSVPGLVISSNEHSRYTTSKNKLRVWGVQGFDSIATFKNYCKIALRVMNQKDIIGFTKKAISESLKARQGPSWLEIPINIQSEIYMKKNRVSLKCSTKNLNFAINKKNKHLIKEKILKVLKLLKNKKKPLLLIGNGARDYEGNKFLKKLLKKLNIPFLLTWSSADLLSHDHKMYFGKSGVYGQRSSNFILQNCDLLISLGSRLSLLQIGYDIRKFCKNSSVVQVDVDFDELKKFKEKRFLKIHSDCNYFFKILYESIKGIKTSKYENWLNYCNKIKKKFPTLIPQHINKKEINSYELMERLNKVLKRDEIVVTDMGTALLTAFYNLKVKNKIKLMTSQGLGEMGFGLPGAIGASIANKKSRVLCLNNDGGMMFNLQELETIKFHNLPIKILVFCNDGYLMIKHTQKNSFGGKYVGVDRGSGVSCPNFCKISNAFGIDSLSIKNWNEFDKKFSIFYNSNKPYLCEVHMPVEQAFIPRQANARDKNNKIYSLPLEDQIPFLDRKLFKDSFFKN
tara:strand:- start:183 stop:1826 length:1644 start_codon:yes stop_codon:yes gene_type:complete